MLTYQQLNAKINGNVYFSLDFEQDKLISDPHLENRAEYQFENGAVYRGQWRGLNREGYGV